MAAGVKRVKEDEGILLRNYVEAIFYECVFSAQYTANRQTLFKIEDIAMRMPPDSFASKFPSTKSAALELIHETINEWKSRMDPTIAHFFEGCDLSKTASLVLQKGAVSATVDERTYRLNLKDQGWSESVVAAIELLHYPLIVMERIQRNRSGQLLDLDADAEFITLMANEFEEEGKALQRRLCILNQGSAKKKAKVTK